MLQTVKRPGVYSTVAILCTKTDPWSYSIRIWHIFDFGLPSVVIIPWLCRRRRKAIFTHSPGGSFVSTGDCNLEGPGSNPGRAGYFHCGCAYTVVQTVQRPGMYRAAYVTVHYKEPLNSLEIRVGHSPGFGLPSVAILPWLCRKRRKAISIYTLGAGVEDIAWAFLFIMNPLLVLKT